MVVLDKKSGSSSARVGCSTPECAFGVTTVRLKSGQWHFSPKRFHWQHSAFCLPACTQLPLRPSFLASLPVIQSTLCAHPKTSVKALHNSLLSSGKKVGYQQVRRAKHIALRGLRPPGAEPAAD